MSGPASRIALVTGGGTGVGRAAAEALLGAGFHVALTGRRLDKLQETAAALDPGGERTVPVAADVGKADEVARLFATVTERHGRLDLLFNNAGVGARPVPLEDLDAADWQRVVDANLTGTFLCIQQAFRIMKAQEPKGGRIINNGSISAHVPRPNSAPYTATKHGVTGLTRAASLDGRRHNIAVGQIDIGNADTAMAATMKTGMPQANGTMAVEPVMDVADVGRAVAFMASLPLDSNVQFMTVMATAMPYIGRG